MALADDLERIASVAQAHEPVSGVLAAELLDGTRVYLCAFGSGAWLALGDDGEPISSRRAVHEAASLAALCELVEELADVEPTLPRLASNEYLDAIGTRLGPGGTAALEQSLSSVEALADQVVARHLTPLA
ncbi:MAG TPA: hypothetical protein VGG88_04940 [Gaiellaceae bacterium]|jgi:hypothetical protein